MTVEQTDVEYSEINLLKDNLKDELLNLFLAHSRTVELFYEINDNSYEIFSKITDQEFKEFNIQLPDNEEIKEEMTQFKITEIFNNFKNQFSNSYLIFFKYKYKFKSLPNINELKEILMKIDEYLKILFQKNLDWFNKICDLLIIPNKNSKFLKFFTNLNSLENLTFSKVMKSILDNFEDSRLILSCLPNNFNNFDKSSFKKVAKLLSESDLKLQDKLSSYEKLIKQQSPIFQSFEKVNRVDELLTFPEFYFERKLSEVGTYQPDAKKASKKVINKNLMLIFKVIFEITPTLEKINDVVIWICKNYIIFTQNQVKEKILCDDSNDEKLLIIEIKNLLKQTFLNDLYLNDEYFNNLLINLIKNSNEKTDYLKKIRILVDYLSKNLIIFKNFINLNVKFNKLNKIKNLNFKNCFVYSIFDQQFSSFNLIIKNMMELIERNSNGDLDKFIKNDYTVLELYQLAKEVPRLGNCIDLNQLNTKKVINDSL